jgi:hypothetical protein
VRSSGPVTSCSVAQCPGERALKHAAAPGERALGHLAASHDPRSVIAPDGHALEALASHARTLAPATASHYRAPGSPPNMRLLDVGGRLDLHMLGSTSGRWEPGEALFFFSSSCRTVPVSRDENDTDIFRPYSRSNPFRWVLIRPYPSPDI